MDKETAPTVIVSIEPSGHIDYDPPGETRLDITLIDEHGTPFPVIIQGQALLALPPSSATSTHACRPPCVHR